MKKLADLDVSGKRVFVRADLDVSLGQTTDNRQTASPAGRQTTEQVRLRNLRPTGDWLLEHGARQIVIAGHIGRPEGCDPSLSTRQLMEPLGKILGRKMNFSEHLTFNNLQLTEGSIVLIENLRFWPGEVANDVEFARQLAGLAEVYVNEAFGNCHRAHASMVVLPGLLPHAAGLHLLEEVAVLSELISAPARPFVAIVGGVKIETKLPVIANLARVADLVLVGGLVAKEYQNLKIKNQNDGSSLRLLSGSNDNILVAKLTQNDREIDDESMRQFEDEIAGAKTVVWNGPLGKFEEGYIKGNRAIAQAVVGSGAFSVVGGGETTEMLAGQNLLDKFSFVSSGGGAMLEFLAGKKLPGIEALN